MNTLSNTKLKGVAKGQTKGFVNAYICSELHSTITTNVDNGFIPDQIVCPKCDEVALSMVYHVNQNLTPIVEFFRPSESQIQAAELSMTKEQALSHRNYLNNGGLISREVKKTNLKSI